jgi:tetratricopeptide (TPR) repeat protein
MKIMFRFLLIILSFECFSQNSDIEKIKVYLVKTSNAIKNAKIDSAYYYSDQGLKIATNIENLKYQARCNIAIARIQFAEGKTKDAYNKAKLALGLANKIKDSETILDANLQMANVHFYNMEDEKAMKLYKKNENIAEKNKIITKSLTKTYSNIGLLFFRASNNSATNLKKATYYFSKAIATAKKINDKEEEHLALCFLGGIYIQNGEFDKAIQSNLTSYEYFKKTKNFNNIPHALYGLGEAYIGKGDFASAEKYYMKKLKTVMG